MQYKPQIATCALLLPVIIAFSKLKTQLHCMRLGFVKGLSTVDTCFLLETLASNFMRGAHPNKTLTVDMTLW